MLELWRKYHHSIWSAILLSIRTAAAIGVQKIVAIYYGPAGTTLLSHFQNFIALFTQPIQDSVTNGLVNAFPKKDFKKEQIISTAIVILISLFALSGLILLITKQFQVNYFSFSLQDWSVILLALLLFCFGVVLFGVYLVEQKLRLYTIIIILQWVLFFSISLLIDFEVTGFLLLWISVQAVFSLILLVPIRRNLSFNVSIDENLIHHFKKFLIMGITVWLSSKWVDYYVRDYAIQQFGSIQTGLWQSVVRVSDAYRGLGISFLFLTLYPMLSRYLADGILNLKQLKRYFLMYILAAAIFLTVIYSLADIVLVILYDDQYTEATSLFQLQVLGDFFAFAAFPFSIYLIASVKTKTYVFTELFSAAIYLLFIMAGFFKGIEGIVYAHIIRFVCYLTLLLLIGTKYINDAR